MISDGIFYCCLLVALILFAGEPDLHDAIIENLTQQDSCTSLATGKGDSNE